MKISLDQSIYMRCSNPVCANYKACSVLCRVLAIHEGANAVLKHHKEAIGICSKCNRPASYIYDMEPVEAKSIKLTFHPKIASKVRDVLTPVYIFLTSSFLPSENLSEISVFPAPVLQVKEGYGFAVFYEEGDATKIAIAGEYCTEMIHDGLNYTEWLESLQEHFIHEWVHAEQHRQGIPMEHDEQFEAVFAKRLTQFKEFISSSQLNFET